MHFVCNFYTFLTVGLFPWLPGLEWQRGQLAWGSRSEQRARKERGRSEEDAGRVFRWRLVGRSWSAVGGSVGRAGSAWAATFAQRSSLAVLLCLCPCAPSRLVPCRVRRAVRPAVLASARLAACRLLRFALAPIVAFALAPMPPVPPIRAEAVRVRAVRLSVPVPSPAVRCSGHRQSRPPRPPAELVRSPSRASPTDRAAHG